MFACDGGMRAGGEIGGGGDGKLSFAQQSPPTLRCQGRPSALRRIGARHM